jgi:autotransporter-associated beta strand protein
MIFHKDKLRSLIIIILSAIALNSFAQRNIEFLDRGLVAVKVSNGVFLSWRVLGTDPRDIGFNIYRGGTKVNSSVITGATNITDASGTASSSYTVRAVINGTEQAPGGFANVWASQVLTVNLQRPAGGSTPDGVAYTYEPNDISIGDVDGDGQWELILKWNPTNAKDNSHSGYTGNVYIDCYKLNGTRLWRIDLGRNIRAGAHYTQVLVGDYDSDGYAEIVCKTAPGTKDGTGTFLSHGPAANDNDNADYRNTRGYVLSGPEYLTIFNGRTGKEMATVNYNPARGTVSSWGDNYGNRVDRFNATNAYLDGKKPSIVYQRGYYTRMTVAAWDWDGKTLKQRWFFDSNASGNGAMAGNGNHSIMAADGDGDGFDEIYTGSGAINHDGKLMWCTRLGHGDANHIGDFNLNNPGLEIWQVTEQKSAKHDHLLIDAKTGKILWGSAGGTDNGRGMTGDIDIKSPGHEMWSSSIAGIYSQTGDKLSNSKPSRNFRVYWDGDLLDELLDGTRIDKWNGNGVARLITLTGHSCNGTKATPNISADILGDWREEVITHDGASKLFIHTTTIPTAHKIYTLMHDPVYRNAISWQQSSYNQPPHLGFNLRARANNIPVPNISLVTNAYNAPPHVNMSAPADNASFAFRSNIDLSAQASDSDGSIASVSFYNGASLIGTASSTPYSFNWRDVPTGTYSITARATDNKGSSSTSAPVTITVMPGTFVYTNNGSNNQDWDNTNNWAPKALPTAIDTAAVRNGELKIYQNTPTFIKVEPNGTLRTIGYFTVPQIVLQGGTLKVYTSNTTYGFNSALTVEHPSILQGGSTPASIFNLDGTLKGSAGLTKTSSGILRLNADATGYTGSWNILEGAMQIAKKSAIGENTVKLATGTTLDIAASNVYINEIISSNATISLSSSLTVKKITVNGTDLRPGSYTSASHPGTITGSGVLTVLGTDDCAGIKDGTAYYDNCGNCVEGSTGKTACSKDCEGSWGGTAIIDSCGLCSGGSTGRKTCTSSAQAEEACSYDGTFDSNNAGYTGAGFVNFTNTLGSAMLLNLISTEAGKKTFTVRYANGGTAARSMDFSASGNTVTVNFARTGSWTTWHYADIEIELKQGVNRCSFVALGADGGPNFDQFIFTDATLSLGSCATDCSGLPGGQAFIDNCSACVGGNTGIKPCVQDCNGDWGGDAHTDECNVCAGGNTEYAACVTQSINLTKGWNLFSTNVHTADSTIAALFNGLDVAEIKTMDSFWRAGQPDYLNSLQSIAAGQGYLVKMNTAGTLTVTGTHCTGVLQYAPTGWQLIGCPYQTATPISSILGNNISVVKNFDGFWIPDLATNSILNIEPGKGYFIKK